MLRLLPLLYPMQTVLFREPCRLQIDAGNSFGKNAKQLIRNGVHDFGAGLHRLASCLITAVEDGHVSFFDIGQVRNIHHTHIHADSARHRDVFSMEKYSNPVGKAPAISIPIADGNHCQAGVPLECVGAPIAHRGSGRDCPNGGDTAFQFQLRGPGRKDRGPLYGLENGHRGQCPGGPYPDMWPDTGA